MVRQIVAAVTAPGRYPTDGVVVTPTAANVTDKEKIRITGRELILAHNAGDSTRAVTIDSVALNGRTGNISDSIAAGAIHVYGPFDLDGWQQTDGYLNCEAAHSDIKWMVIRF